ncbi:hypothetical protein I569_00235 [Enterococcus dispar ATCC 51266]|uniref:Uncharacterized protein n=2 Tax=Enterococcus dispar TaxID=44009 RepID=S1NXR9_9ENTE|nr:hypothetical protein OMK_00964 [Enterococcus dispar ATCC 51266]EOW84946.1 hypothetical protein I569_00235 [Enterococcus dispar ATCC 51266]
MVMLMSNQRVTEVFNDGILTIKTQTTLRSDTGKKLGVTDEKLASVRFRNMSIRESDITTMQALDSRIAKKVKSPMHPICRDFNNDKYFAVIGGNQFNVIYVDSDNYFAFWYLEKVGEYSERTGKETSNDSDNHDQKEA